MLGIKFLVEKTRLLKEFLSQMTYPMELEKYTGMFIPTGAVHILCNNNYFLQSITMVPLGDFQHETLEIPFSMDKNTDIKQTNLYDLITSQQWCINLEKTITPNKVLLVTTKGQLTTARKWVDDMLPGLYKQQISNKIKVTTLKHLTPQCLDKPMAA